MFDAETIVVAHSLHMGVTASSQNGQQISKNTK